MSTFHITPYINFRGRAREAMEFYHRILGGHLDLLAAADDGGTKVAGPDDRIMHAQLEAEGAHIFASDGHPDYPPTVGDHIGIALGGTDASRITAIFNGLAEGGYVKSPLAEQPWGGQLGWLMDKFGINWMITLDRA